MQTNILPREKELHTAHEADYEIIGDTVFEMMAVCRNLAVSLDLFDDTPDERVDLKEDLATVIGRLYRCRQFADDVVLDISKTLSKANSVVPKDQIQRLKERAEVLTKRGTIARSAMSKLSEKYEVAFPTLDEERAETTEIAVTAMYSTGIGNLIYAINFLSMINIPEYLKGLNQKVLKEIDQLILDMINEKYTLLHSLADHISNLHMWATDDGVSADDADAYIQMDIQRLVTHLDKVTHMISDSLRIIREKAPALHEKLRQDFVYTYLVTTYFAAAK